MEEEKAALMRIEQLLEENLAVAEENNKMLKSIRRANRWSLWLRILLWAVVIILPLLLIKPLINAFLPGSSTGTPGLNFLGIPSQSDIQKALDSYQGGQ